MMRKPRHNSRKNQSGNIFFMLFASVALVGAFGVGASNVMKGLVASMSDVTRKTIAEEKMTSGARLAVQNATATQGTGGNCDADPLVEPLPFRNAGTGSHPVGGGYLPLEIGATLNDPWGTAFGYCAWDPGTVRDDPGCGGPGANRRIGMGSNIEATAGLVVAVVSAGKDRRFSTTCNDFVDVAPADGVPDTPLIGRGTGGDDIIFEYTYNEANGLSGDDLWRVKDTAPDTAQIDKDVEIGGDASMEGVLELRNRGLLLPDDTETGPCTALNEAELRINTSSSPSVLEICYDMAWEPISMGSSGGGGAPGECGENWALEPAGQVGGLGIGEDIAYGNNLYVAVGTDGIKTSPDGVTWTARTKPAGTMDPTGIVFGNGRFVATAHSNGTWSTMTSTDGITWTAGNSTQSGLNNLAYGANMYVAVGWGGYIISSPDGTNWTQRSATGNDWRDIIYANGRFLAIGAPPASNVATSNDGITWTIQAGSSTPYTRIAYGENLYAGTANSNMLYSSNGISWTGTSVGSGDWNRVIYTTTGKFVAIHYNSGEIAFSDDGMAWTIETGLLDNTKLWLGLIEGDGKLIATATDGTVYSSFCDSQEVTEAPEITLPDPVVQLKLDEQTGTNVIDTMNRVTATLTGATSPPTVMGQIGRAYDLDGTNDRILITGNASINSLSQYTISFWLYGVNSGSFQYLVDNRDTGTNGLRFVRNDTTNYLTLTVGNGGNFTTNQAVPNNAWTHIALTYNSQNLTLAPIIYINGVAATYSAANLPTTASLAGANWSIGSNYAGTSAWNPGTFDDFRIFGQVLSPEQITLLYNDRTSTTYVAPNPAAIIAAGKYRGKITAFENQACGIKEDGSAWCWGDEATGSMGNGTATHGGTGYVSPVRVDTIRTANNFTQVSMGLNFSCALKSDRTAWCWGTDTAGQLGNGAVTTGTQHNPVSVGITTPWTQITAGGYHACGILQLDSRIYCWGDGGTGQLGTSTGPNTLPAVVTEPGPWVYVTAGWYHTCGIKADGSAWCWGDQNYGRLGNGLTTAASVNDPSPVLETGPWVKLDAGGHHTCGIKLDGSAWCWGQQTSGKLGNGVTTSVTGIPQRVLDTGPWIDIEAAGYDDTSCGIKYDGTLWCWGTDSSQQLGNGSGSSSQSSPSRVLDPGPWASVILGTNMACGLKVDGSAWCWGSDTNGRLGNGTTLTGTQNVPTRVENFPSVAPFAFNDAQTVLTRNTAATSISLGSSVGWLGFDGNSGGLGGSLTGLPILRNPNGNVGLSIESTGAFDSQLSLKTFSGATTRSIGVDNVTGNLEFGNNIAAVTNFMSAITPHMVINNVGQVGVGTQVPGARLGITGGGLRVGNDTRVCTISRKGVLRFNSGVMQYCNGNTWTNM